MFRAVIAGSNSLPKKKMGRYISAGSLSYHRPSFEAAIDHMFEKAIEEYGYEGHVDYDWDYRVKRKKQSDGHFAPVASIEYILNGDDMPTRFLPSYELYIDFIIPTGREIPVDYYDDMIPKVIENFDEWLPAKSIVRKRRESFDVNALLNEPIANAYSRYDVQYKISEVEYGSFIYITLSVVSALGYQRDELENMLSVVNSEFRSVSRGGYGVGTFDLTLPSISMEVGHWFDKHIKRIESAVYEDAKRYQDFILELVNKYNAVQEYADDVKSYMNTLDSILSQSMPDIELAYKGLCKKDDDDTYYTTYEFTIPSEGISFERDFVCPLNIDERKLLKQIQGRIDRKHQRSQAKDSGWSRV